MENNFAMMMILGRVALKGQETDVVRRIWMGYMYTEVVNKKDCTGCGACENLCPENAIHMHVDKEGFCYPAIDDEKCIQCGECLNVCPVFDMPIKGDKGKNIQAPKVYAAWSMDQDIRYHSTSGGIFSELALSILKRGGYICGAVYDENQEVKHYITNKVESLEKLRQSKYVQSEMKDIYKKIEDLLKKNETVLFSGTPCQCKGVYNYCKEKGITNSNLYMVDFICRGVNSPKVYRKFLGELEDQYGSGVIKVWFKNKTYGWNRFSTKIEFENGENYLKDRYHDTYIRGYIEENLFIRPSCTVCRFKGLHRVADLTLADFWGVKLEEGYMQDSDNGTSMVMVHTEHGKRLWDSISPNIYKTEKKMDDVIPGNICFENSIHHSVYRKQFMDDLDNMSVINNIERFLDKNS